MTRSGSVEQHSFLSRTREALALRRYLGRRLFPVALIVMLLVLVSAPAAFLGMRVAALQQQADRWAQQVSALVQREARLQPVLWRYNSIKLLEHLRRYRFSRLLQQIEIWDSTHKRPILRRADRGKAETTRAPLIWGRASIILGQDTVGHVYVAVSTRRARWDASLLSLLFLLLGLGVVWLVLAIPDRAMGRAEGQLRVVIGELHDTQSALADLNQNLEAQVQARALELTEAYALLQTKEENLRELTARTFAWQEQERRGIARDLHDSVGQALTAVRIHLQLLPQVATSPETLAETSQVLMQMTDQVLEEVRRAVMSLGPAVLDDFGLASALRKLCEDTADRTALEVFCAMDSLPPGLPAGVESACYRIVQESLTNVVRHAQAHHVWVDVCIEESTSQGDVLWLQIRDDGCGFVWEPSAAQRKRLAMENHRGLSGMRERCELLGGTWELQTEVGEGVQIKARLPLFAKEGAL